MPELRAAIRAELALMARGGELGSIIGKANASADAQQAGSGLGIQNVRRGVLWVVSTDPDNMTVSSTTFVSLPTPLKGTMVLSGRPLLVMVNAVVGTTSEVLFDVYLRGASMSGGKTGGLSGGYTSGSVTFGRTPWSYDPSPSPGSAEIELMIRVGGTSATVYTDPAANTLSILALEL